MMEACRDSDTATHLRDARLRIQGVPARVHKEGSLLRHQEPGLVRVFGDLGPFLRRRSENHTAHLQARSKVPSSIARDTAR